MQRPRSRCAHHNPHIITTTLIAWTLSSASRLRRDRLAWPRVDRRTYPASLFSLSGGVRRLLTGCRPYRCSPVTPHAVLPPGIALSSVRRVHQGKSVMSAFSGRATSGPRPCTHSNRWDTKTPTRKAKPEQSHPAEILFFPLSCHPSAHRIGAAPYSPRSTRMELCRRRGGAEGRLSRWRNRDTRHALALSPDCHFCALGSVSFAGSVRFREKF